MKQATLQKLIISIVLCYLQQNAMAQSKWQFGVYAGGNVSKLKPGELAENPAYPFAEQYKWTPSYNLGAYIDLLISKKLYFESGINIISKNSINVSPKEINLLNTSYFDSRAVVNYQKHYYSEVNHKSVAFQIPLSIHLIIFQKRDFKTNLHVGFLWENMFSHSVATNTSNEWIPANPPAEILGNAVIYEKKFGNFSKFSVNETAFEKSNIGSFLGFGFSYKKIGIDLGINNSTRKFISVQYQNSSITFNVRYQIK